MDQFCALTFFECFGADIFSPDKAQVLRPPGAYKAYVTKGAKAATQAGGKRSSQKVVWGYMVK